MTETKAMDMLVEKKEKKGKMRIQEYV